MKILFATDFSRGAQAARDFLATSFSDPAHATIHVVHFLERPRVPSDAALAGEIAALLDAARDASARSLAEEVAILREYGWPATGDVRDARGAAYRDIVDLAAASGADIVAVAARGRTGEARFDMGTTAPIVLAEAPCSVLVLRGAPVERRARRIILAVDDSPEAAAATELVAAIGKSPAADVTVLAVADTRRLIPDGVARAIAAAPGRGRALAPFTQQAREEARAAASAAADVLRRRGVPFGVVEREGHPAEAIVEEARERGADLVVLGARAAGSVLGGVTRKVARYAPCSVLAVRAKGRAR